MLRSTKPVMGAVVLAFALAVTACGSNTVAGVDTSHNFTQIERLGNPLVSEVFFPKRDHGLDNTNGPDVDSKTMVDGGTDVPGHIRSFLSQFGRSDKIITTLGAVLSPDMLMVYPNRPPAGAGWLSWALANGYGGRMLQDDVVDAGLTASFGNLLDPSASVVAGLTSDNVPASVRTFSNTFPYLDAPK
jgi:predicted small secreted protein